MTTLEIIRKKGYDVKFTKNTVIISKRNTESSLLSNGRESTHNNITAALRYIRHQY